MDKLVCVVAGYEMASNEFILESRSNLLADISRVRAARVEPAAVRRIDWAGDFARQNDSCSLVFDVRYRNRRNQCLRIWMKRIIVESVRLGEFHNFPEVHDCYSMANLTY